MSKVIIVVENGRVTNIYARNKNIECEVIDLDTLDENDLKEKEQRLRDVSRSRSYKDIC